MRASIEGFQKQLAAAQKAKAGEVIAKGLTKMEADVAAAAEAGQPFVVLDVELGTDSKAVKSAVKMCKKDLHQGRIMLILKMKARWTKNSGNR